MAIYLITGAAGFIGSNLTNHLLNQGDTVIGLDNFSTGKKANLDFTKSHPNKQNFSLIEGDIRDLTTCEKACAGVDYALHQAALGSVPRSIKEPLLYHENNITGTLNMLLAAQKAQVKRFVFASSSSVYGDTPTLPKIETMLPCPKSPYAISKLTGEYYCAFFTQTYNLPAIALRYFNVFGAKQDPESQYAAAIPKFVTAFASNTAPTIFGDGEQTRDFTYITNVIEANLKACKADLSACGLAYNVGCAERISINDLANKIKQLTKSKVEPLYEPIRAGDVKDSLASIERIQKNLGYTGSVKFNEGLDKTVAWFLANS